MGERVRELRLEWCMRGDSIIVFLQRWNQWANAACRAASIVWISVDDGPRIKSEDAWSESLRSCSENTIVDLSTRLGEGGFVTVLPSQYMVIRLEVAEIDQWSDSQFQLYREALRASTSWAPILFAYAYIVEGVIVKNGKAYYDGRSEWVPNPAQRGVFYGLPAAPPWLTWYGPSYAPLIDPPRGAVVEELSGGLWVALSPNPMSRREIVASFGVHNPDFRAVEYYDHPQDVGPSLRPATKAPDGVVLGLV